MKGFRDERGRLCARKKHDKDLRAEIRRIGEENFRVYGARKIWKQMNREEIEAARCTAERLMREMWIQGAVRGRKFKTTISDDNATQPTDLVMR